MEALTRVRVYVDGFNLYYRALKRTQFKWLNPIVLSERVLSSDDYVDLLRYFTARVSARAGDLEAPRRQQFYLSALATLPKIKTHFGRFLTKTKWRPTVATGEFVEIHDTEEKGSDVALATYLIHDGWSRAYDLALVMSQDTDLIEPIRVVTQELGLKVGLVWLDGRQPNPKLAKVSSFVRHVTHADLAASQLLTTIAGPNGKMIGKPEAW